jgi:hypothetical protein
VFTVIIFGNTEPCLPVFTPACRQFKKRNCRRETYRSDSRVSSRWDCSSLSTTDSCLLIPTLCPVTVHSLDCHGFVHQMAYNLTFQGKSCARMQKQPEGKSASRNFLLVQLHSHHGVFYYSAAMPTRVAQSFFCVHSLKLKRLRKPKQTSCGSKCSRQSTAHKIIS